MESGSQYVSKLNEYAQKKRLKPPEYEDLGSSGPDHMKTFTQRVRLNGELFPESVGKSKREAKHNAAKNAFEMLSKRGQTEEPVASRSCRATETPGQEVSHASDQTATDDELCNKTEELSVNSEDYSFTKKPDFVSMVNTYCQKTQRSHNYNEVSREGPSHNLLFTYRLEINKKYYPVGKGNNKKDAKQMAAQLAWCALQEQSDWDSKVSVGSAPSEDDTSPTPSSTQKSEVSEVSQVSFQRIQNSSESDWIQFKDSTKPSNAQTTPNAQVPSHAQDAAQGENDENSLTTSSTESRFNSTYDSIERLGKGSFGCVYKARNTVLDKYYAIKEILCKDTEKSLQEVKVLSDLLHPNIVRYYTFWFEDTRYKCPPVNSKVKLLYIEMELCDGGTLRRWINERNKDSSQDSRQQKSVQFTEHILSGVAYIHSNKLIHRDLKPANILFGRDENVRIGDFGLATQDNDDDMTEGRGTPSYMAPEQLGTNYDRKVDVYALGLIFFELLWRMTTGHERVLIWKDVRNQNLPKEFTVAHPLESRIITTMLSERPGDRPEASAIKTEIEKWYPTPKGDDQGNRTI